MLITPRSTKRLGLLLALLILLCLTPAAAWANAPSPYTPEKRVTLSDTRNVNFIRVYVDGPDGTFYLFQTFESEHTKQQSIVFVRPDDAARFYVEVTMADGTVRASEPMECSGSWAFEYNVRTNTLKKATVGWNWLTWIFLLLSVLGVFGLPLIFTILVEFLAALPFKLKPYKHVVVINVITNLIMNLLLIVLRSFWDIVGREYLWLTLALEVGVVIAEFLFYLRKYPEREMGTLLGYTLLANALSWGLYELFRYLGFA